MKRLKILLHYKIYLLLFLTIIYVVIIVSNNYYKSNYKLDDKDITGIITSIKIDGNKVSIVLRGREKVLVNYYFKNKEELELFNKYKLGYKIRIKGNLIIPNNNSNFYLFNYRKYLLSKNIYYIMSADNITLINTKVNLFYSIKNKIIDRVNDIDTGNYLKTFILGDNSLTDNNVKDSYQLNGISHLFSVSGMHVTILSSILFFILNKIIKNKKISFFIISLNLFLFMFLTGLSSSIVRATLLFFLINFNNIFNLKIKIINIYIFIICIVLFINPYNIYNNGFLFSYIISLYLIVFSKIINRHKNYFIKLLITSLISFLVSIPIMINSYYSINIISFIYNLFYVPLISFIIFPLALITIIFPIFSSLLKIFINLLENSSFYLSSIKVFNISFRYMPIYIFFIYYILISFILFKIIRKKYFYIVILIVTLFIHSNINILDSNLYTTYLDVGQGDSSLIKLPNNKGNILIDTGGKVNYVDDDWKKKSNNYNITTSTIIPFLKASGIKKLDYLIITHGDYDHMGEAINLINNFKVDKVIFNCGEYNDLEKELIKVLDKKKIKYYDCIKELNIDNNKLYFLQTKEYDNENDNSNVIYTELNGYKFMFMGDASITTEKEIMNKYNLPNIDVLKVGHHGSKTSSSKEFINEINPKYSIISVGKNNRYGHPNKEVLNNLENSKVYRTDQDGSIMLRIKNNKLKIETCSS